MGKNKFLFLAFLVSIVLLSSGCALIGKGLKEEKFLDSKAPEMRTVLELYYDEENIESFEVSLAENQTVFDQLKRASQRHNFTLDYEQGQWGVFIKQIGQKKNGQVSKYWQYWVNDEFAQVAADGYKLKEGDKVDWKFIESQF